MQLELSVTSYGLERNVSQYGLINLPKKEMSFVQRSTVLPAEQRLWFGLHALFTVNDGKQTGSNCLCKITDYILLTVFSIGAGTNNTEAVVVAVVAVASIKKHIAAFFGY